MKNKYIVFISTAFLIVSCTDFINTEKNNLTKTAEQSKTTSEENLFGSDFTEPTDNPFSEKNLLLNLGLNVISPLTDAFSDELQIFSLRLEKTCKKSLHTQNDLRNVLMSDWQNVIHNFHKMDSVSFGPITKKSDTTQLDLRTEFYSWPYSNFCLADKFVHDIHFKTQSQPALPFNSKSLETVEYLLFSDLNQVKCNLKAQPQLQNWLNLADKEKLQSRCELAVNLTAELVQKSILLKTIWSRTKGNYSKVIAENTNLKTVINEFTDALYYVESIKDNRLGIPLGKNKKECFTDTCPERIEHASSNLAFVAITARLDGFKEGFFGSSENLPNDHGIDDYLNQSGHSDITLKIKNLLRTAQANLEIIKANGSLDEQILKIDVTKCKLSTSANPIEPVCGFYEDIRSLTITLKTEVLVVLSLKSPPVYQGDND